MPIGEMGRIRLEGNKLVFEDPEEIDTGNYTCIMSNIAGEKRQNVWIMISGEYSDMTSNIFPETINVFCYLKKTVRYKVTAPM